MPDLSGSPGLVLDTSVWINLLASGEMRPILVALAVSCVVPAQVLGEIRRHPISGADFSIHDHPILAIDAISIVALEGPELELFLDIVSAPARDALGDGEAAAIAVASSRQLDLVIDDRKARRITRERFSSVRCFWTVDLLRAQPVVNALGALRAEDCFAKAKRFGRMHVPRL
jgi:predicted nucleic acid-binding protein